MSTTEGSLPKYLNSLSLGDIYGKLKPHPKKVPMTSELYEEWSKLSKDLREREKAQFAKEHGLEAIGSYGGGFVRENVVTRELSWWVPHYRERAFIIRLAQALAGPSKRPCLLEIGCGTGLTAASLAVNNNIHVTGVDVRSPDPNVSHPPNENLAFIESNIWDMYDQFGPVYPKTCTQDRAKRMQTIRRTTSSFGYSEFLAHQAGDPFALNAEISFLQATVNQRTNDTKIDIALCSFMERGVELTIPIRDGVHPMAIIYVRPLNGLAAAGDYYKAYDGEPMLDPDKLNKVTIDTMTDEDFMDAVTSNLTDDSHISYHPGKNYRTFARWQTPSKLTYQIDKGKFRDRKGPARWSDTEVIIQLRKDIKISTMRTPNIARYSFDSAIESAFYPSKNAKVFIQGVPTKV